MTTLLNDTAPAHLAVGEVRLDVGARLLSGPTGEVCLCRGAFTVLAKLMRRPGVTIELGALVEAMWRDPDAEPTNPERAVRMRVARARAALENVGAPRTMLRVVFQSGYRLDGAPRIIRTYTPQEAEALETLLATHPDRALAAALMDAAA